GEVVHRDDDRDSGPDGAVVGRAMQEIGSRERREAQRIPPELAREHGGASWPAEFDRLDVQPLEQVADVTRRARPCQPQRGDVERSPHWTVIGPTPTPAGGRGRSRAT